MKESRVFMIKLNLFKIKIKKLIAKIKKLRRTRRIIRGRLLIG